MARAAASLEMAWARRVWGAVRELADYTDLLRNLVVRDLKVRYRGSIFGFAWSLLNPLLMMAVFTLVFQVLAQYDEIHLYPFFLMAALVPWLFTAQALTSAMRSITSNAQLIKKVYFPRELLPMSAVLASFVNFVLAFLIFWLIGLVFGVGNSPAMFMIPLIMLLQLALVMGLSLILAMANVFFRDTEHLVEVGLLAWFFLTPIFYPLSFVPNVTFLGRDVHRWVLTLNPMATLTTDYRFAIMEGAFPIRHTIATIVVAAVALGFGWWVFRRYAHRFAEEL